MPSFMSLSDSISDPFSIHASVLCLTVAYRESRHEDWKFHRNIGLIDYHKLLHWQQLNVIFIATKCHFISINSVKPQSWRTFIFSEVYFRIRSPVNRQIIESRMKLYDFSGKTICIIYLGKVYGPTNSLCIGII